MEAQSEQIREQQKAIWNKFSPGWKKWDATMMSFMQPMNDAIIGRLKLENGMQVLDVAGGTGEPSLTIAGLIGDGTVTCSDLSEGMLQVAKEKVAERGVTNVKFLLADVSELPFEANSFDAVSCRFGFMFFPEMQRAANEMVRVLKPGGRLATVVWNIAGKNFWVTASMSPIQTLMQLPAPQPNAPGMFRCAAPGLISGMLSQAGLNDVEEVEILSKLNVKTADNYWQLMNDVAAPVVNAMNQADEVTREKIKSETYAAIREKFGDGDVNIDASALIIYGTKPEAE